MISRFGLFCWNIDTGDNPRDEVEKDEFGKDLLVDKVTAQAVEKVHGHSVLQKEKRYFNLPPEVVQIFDFINRKVSFRKICDQIFKSSIWK